MADYDVLDMAVMLRDAQRSLRSLFRDRYGIKLRR